MEEPRNAKILIKDSGEEFEIPEEGSLGLLALGYKGIMLWRMKRRDVDEKRKEPSS